MPTTKNQAWRRTEEGGGGGEVEAIRNGGAFSNELCFYLAGVMPSRRSVDAVRLFGVVDHGEASCRDDVSFVGHVQAVGSRGVSHEWSPCLHG